MAEYESQTIYELISSIETGKLILPAIQRNFVWSEQKVCDLFDSIIRDYPIGTFLFWNISEEQVNDFVFNKFLSFYKEQKNGFQKREVITPDTKHEYIGVLDGQQRITSLYLGIKSYYRMHIKGKRWEFENSYENKYLSIDILYVPVNDEDKYHFAFIKKECFNSVIVNNIGVEEYWVPVSVAFEKDFDAADFVEEIEKDLGVEHFNSNRRVAARKILKNLHDAFRIKKMVNYYPAKEKDLTQVVDIFVRVNSGGVKLSASDLMLSIATGVSSDEDIQVKIQQAIEKIDNASSSQEDMGFKADKELVLTAGLLFTGAESLSLMKKENYSRKRLENILDSWDEIIDAIYCASIFIERIGFIGNKLTSKNLILPISYYFYKNHLGENFIKSSSKKAKRDRVYIRQWLLRAIINSIFRDGTGRTLLQIRKVINESDKEYFPLDSLMNSTGSKSLIIEDFDEMLDYRYKDGRVIPLLLELSKDASGRVYQLDHIWAKSKMNTKNKIKTFAPNLSDTDVTYYKEQFDSLGNLQLLEPIPNQEKSDRFFDDWLNAFHPDESDRYYSDNFIPKGISYDFSNFREFCDLRRELLLEALRESFPTDFDAINERYGLE